MKKLLLAVAIAATVFAVAHRGGHSETPSSGLAFDRIWIDHMPRNERDPVEVFIAMDDYAIGQFIATSRWAGRFEAFQYESHGDELRAVYPQTGKREKMTIKATACNVRGFDYCLEITGSDHGAKHYYSQEDWIIDRSANVDARVHAIVAP
jgi:hypothetical protein